MKTLRGPGVFLTQFIGNEAPFNTLHGLASWAASHGYIGIELPTHHPHIFDLSLASESRHYCDEVAGSLAENGLVITDLSTHLQGQLVAVHPAYDELFNGFAPSHLKGNAAKRQLWAVEQLILAARASANLDLKVHATFSGALLWHMVYPWPQRPDGIVELGFKELAKRWLPVLDKFDEAGVDLCYEIHPGEDLHDGSTFERFLEAVDQHPRCNILYDPSHLYLQCIDYLGFIDHYHSRIKAFHVKDAELKPNAKTGVFGGYLPWVERAGRFRSPGDGQINFNDIFSKFAQYDFDGWAVVEWECALKHPEDGAREGAQFVKDRIIRVTDRPFDEFSGGKLSDQEIRALLGLTY